MLQFIDRERKWVLAIYILQIVGYILPITFIFAVILNYCRQDAAFGSYLESHHTWQIRTFWYGILWLLVGTITAAIAIGIFILLANYVWVLYRAIRGILFLSNNQPVIPYERHK